MSIEKVKENMNLNITSFKENLDLIINEYEKEKEKVNLLLDIIGNVENDLKQNKNKDEILKNFVNVVKIITM